MKLNATRNPYENAELFCTLERIRRKGTWMPPWIPSWANC